MNGHCGNALDSQQQNELVPVPEGNTCQNVYPSGVSAPGGAAESGSEK